MNPTKSKLFAEAEQLAMMFPSRGEALIAAFEPINRRDKKLPDWREVQVVQCIKTVNLYALDVSDRYRVRRADQLATAVRNLFELSVWIEYCSISETNSRTFFDDTTTDMHQLLQCLQELSNHIGGAHQKTLDDLITEMRSEAVASGVTGIDEPYLNVRDVAKALGKSPPYALMNKLLSKLAHPTALFVHLSEMTNPLLEALYVTGQRTATVSLDQIEVFIKGVYSQINL